MLSGGGDATGGARKMKRAARVLLAWEMGLGFGHSTKLARIGARLAAAGCEVMARVPHVALSTPLQKAGIPVGEGPHLPAVSLEERSASATLTDSLAQAGMMNEGHVRRVLAGWRQVLDELAPDLLVLDYAPLATLAARGRVRTVQTGVGYCLPPDHLETFPLLHTIGPPGVVDADMRALVNRALAAEDMAPITRMGELFTGDVAFVTTFQLLDPYADLRTRPADGPLVTEPLMERQPGADGIFAYLHPDVAGRDHVLDALAALGPRLEIYVPQADERILSRLSAAGVAVHTAPQRLAPLLARKRLILHQGSAGIAADALAAGVPQYTLCHHVEHYLNGESVAAAGVGRNRHLFEPSYRVDPADIIAFSQDEEAAFLAEAAGRMHRAELEALDPLETLIARCLACLPGHDLPGT